MPIKTFRGKIADGTQDLIRLGTNKGMIGYRIHKFQCIPASPGQGTDVESVMKLYKTDQTSAGVDAAVNFEDSALIGVIYYQDESTQHNPTSIEVIFDREVFNQDIYLTYESFSGSQDMNYYIELEQIKLDLGEATVATLKDMRGTN